MNVGFAIAGWLFDLLRRSLGEYGTLALPGGIEISTYRAILLTSFAITIPAIIFTWIFLREGVEMTEEGVKITPERPKYAGVNVFVALYRMSKEALQDTARIFVDVCKQSTFHRFLIFLTLIAFVRLVFYHMHFTFPKYGIRELGEGAPVGNLWGVLNPITIVILAPIVGALSHKVSSYKMISWGTSISALPVLLLAMPRQIFQPLADSWFGHLIGHTWLHVEGAIDPLYVSITLFVFIFSIGEAIWSPRLYEYTASIAPKGQAGSYMALSLLPYFLAKLIVGLMSGRLLEAYCPATGPRHSETLWLIIGAMAIVCPVGIITLRKYIRSREEGRD
jgi:dipeptide/tripeptide permease